MWWPQTGALSLSFLTDSLLVFCSDSADVCSFMRGGTGGALPEPYIMTSSRLLGCMFLTVRNGLHEGLKWFGQTCAHSPVSCSLIGICKGTLELAVLPFALIMNNAFVEIRRVSEVFP